METQAHPCVLVFLRHRIQLALAKNWPIAELSISGETFVPIGPRWSGFYDWLRDSGGRTIGVRYHPTEHTDFVLGLSESLKYAEIGNFRDLALYFGESRAIDPATSEDQNFLYDQVFESETGAYAIAFAKPDLVPEERFGLADAAWVIPSITYGQRDR